MRRILIIPSSIQPVYDEPTFIVNNIWRLYGGWYDQNPSHLKPPRDSDLAKEICQLSGMNNILARAEELAKNGNFPLASSLIEFAHQADPSNQKVTELRAKIYQKRATGEMSLMARNTFKAVSREFQGEDSEDTTMKKVLSKRAKDSREYMKAHL